MPEKSESDIARIARLSGLKPEQVRYDLKEHCVPKGNQLQVTISDNQALKILSEKRNKILWFKSCDILPESNVNILIKERNEVLKSVYDHILNLESEKPLLTGYWAYITPDMLPKGEKIENS